MFAFILRLVAAFLRGQRRARRAEGPPLCELCSRMAGVAISHPVGDDRHRQSLRAELGDGTMLSVPVPADLTAGEAFTADTQRRIISGLVLPYGEVGLTSVGPVTAGPGSARLPADLTRVKLVDYHQTPPRAVGYATAAREDARGRWLDFRVASTPEGDRALLEASEHVSDAFSVELYDLQLDAGGGPVPGVPHIADSALSAVALLGVPAFPSARVASVTAALNPTPEGNRMNEEQRRRLAELLGMNQRTAEQEAEFQQLTQLAVSEAATGTTPPEGQQPPATPEGQPAQLAAGQQPQVVTLNVTTAPATAPQGLTPAGEAGHGAGSPRPLADLYAAAARVAVGVSQPAMEAALADITNGGNPYVSQDQYAGQLWSGLDYQRRFVPLMSAGTLGSWKGTGWRWVTPPEVADYAGDKADVPSNAVTTEDEPWVAARLAGAHDIDRKFRDFGDTEFMEAYYKAMTLSYARKSDAKARAFLVANATAGAAVAGGLLKAVGTTVQRVEDATDGGAADWVMVNSTDKLNLLDLTNFDVPAFLSTWNIDPGKFIGTPAVAAGTVVAGMRAASEFKELPGSPIRVETVSISDGGIDGGVFGYYATLLNDASAIQSAAYAA